MRYNFLLLVKISRRYAKSAEFVHHDPLVIHKRMRISLQGDGSRFMPEQFRQGFDIHAAFQRPCRKGMPKRMKALVRNIYFIGYVTLNG